MCGSMPPARGSRQWCGCHNLWLLLSETPRCVLHTEWSPRLGSLGQGSWIFLAQGSAPPREERHICPLLLAVAPQPVLLPRSVLAVRKICHQTLPPLCYTEVAHDHHTPATPSACWACQCQHAVPLCVVHTRLVCQAALVAALSYLQGWGRCALACAVHCVGWLQVLHHNMAAARGHDHAVV